MNCRLGIYKTLVRKQIISIPLQITLIYYILHDDRLNNEILSYKDLISGNEFPHTIFTIITFNKTYTARLSRQVTKCTTQ